MQRELRRPSLAGFLLPESLLYVLSNSLTKTSTHWTVSNVHVIPSEASNPVRGI